MEDEQRFQGRQGAALHGRRAALSRKTGSSAAWKTSSAFKEDSEQRCMTHRESLADSLSSPAFSDEQRYITLSNHEKTPGLKSF